MKKAFIIVGTLAAMGALMIAMQVPRLEKIR